MSDNADIPVEGDSGPSTSAVAEEGSAVPSSEDNSLIQSRLQTDLLLTDSENTNNENRVIEMEGAANLASVAGDVGEPAESNVEESDSTKEEASGEKSGIDKSSLEIDKYGEHTSYNEQGEAIYTDPETKFQYKWSEEKSEWVPAKEEGGEDSSPYENEHYRWCHETSKWVPKETDHYRWCENTKQWIPKEQSASEEDRSYSYENGVHQYTDKDGAVYFWDEGKKAWFPKVDDEFMAVYQLNYGFVDNTSGESSKETEETPQPSASDVTDEQLKALGKKRKAPPEPPKWFELKPEHNTKVYVSNLPLDITEEEFGEIMSKCGMILKDPKTNKLKMKLYRDSNSVLKGDGLCHYIKIESVDLALNILDNYDVRGHKIRVQRAEFQLKGEYNPSLKPKVRKKEKEKQRKMQEALFDWRPEKMRGERSKHERIVIIKNLFEPALFEREVHLLLEYQNDLREESNKCGSCRRVVLFDRHPEGVAQITMSDPEEADLVVKLMHGRFFGKRKLTAEIWDGRTKYRVAETEADVNKRLDNWEKYLEKEEAAAATGDGAGQPMKETEKQLAKPAEPSPDDGSKAPEKAMEEKDNREKADEDDDPQIEKTEPPTAKDKTEEEPSTAEAN